MPENFCIFECLLNQLIKARNFLDSFRLYGRLLENPKIRASAELFLPENDFKTSKFYSKFPKNCPDFGGLETNERDEPQARFFFSLFQMMHFYIRTQYNIKIGLNT